MKRRGGRGWRGHATGYPAVPSAVQKLCYPSWQPGRGVFVARRDAAHTTVASMPKFFHPLFHCFANARHRDLVAQVEYLKAENQVLRPRLPKRVTVAVLILRRRGSIR